MLSVPSSFPPQIPKNPPNHLKSIAGIRYRLVMRPSAFGIDGHIPSPLRSQIIPEFLRYLRLFCIFSIARIELQIVRCAIMRMATGWFSDVHSAHPVASLNFIQSLPDHRQSFAGIPNCVHVSIKALSFPNPRRRYRGIALAYSFNAVF